MGIKDIQKNREDEKTTQQQRSQTQELWLKDDEQAYVAVVPTGEENDQRLGDLYFHSTQFTRDNGSVGWRSDVCGRTLKQKCERCENGDRPSHQFAFWAYVFYVMHPKQDGDAKWEAVKGGSGVTRFKETVNSFRIFRKGFGKNDYLWNMLVEIYNEDGALNKHVVKIGRRGTERDDTAYTITATTTEIKLTGDIKKAAGELPSISDVFVKKEEQEEEGKVSEKKPRGKVTAAPKSTDESLFADDDDKNGGDLF